MPQSKYKFEETNKKAFLLARDKGLTNGQISKALGINPDTFYTWSKKFPKFKEAVEKGREASIGEVENAMYKEALGYWIEEVKQYIQEKPVAGSKDKTIKIKKVEKTKKWMRPSLGAQVFILKNRCPDRWKESKYIESETFGKLEEKQIGKLSEALGIIENLAKDNISGNDKK